MQSIFFDVPVDLLERSAMLQAWQDSGQVQPVELRQAGYARLLLQSAQRDDLLALIETITYQECVNQILHEMEERYRGLLAPELYQRFRARAAEQMRGRERQLRSVIRQDLTQLLDTKSCFNVSGYLCFAANRLKRLLQRLMQEEYHRLDDQLEQEEFVELLRFFVAVQPSVLECAYLTFYGSRFTLTDEWGNDLRQIYLESLQEEEKDVSDNDLIMSILITLLPQQIYLEVKEPPISDAFLQLLQQVFGDQLIWRQTERQ